MLSDIFLNNKALDFVTVCQQKLKSLKFHAIIVYTINLSNKIALEALNKYL